MLALNVELVLNRAPSKYILRGNLNDDTVVTKQL